MNNDIKDLVLAKKEKISEWLEYLNSEEDDKYDKYEIIQIL